MEEARETDSRPSFASVSVHTIKALDEGSSEPQADVL
jgi:hypothetical protein